MKTELSLNNSFRGFSNLKYKGKAPDIRLEMLKLKHSDNSSAQIEKNSVDINKPADSVSFSGFAVSENNNEKETKKSNWKKIGFGALAAGTTVLSALLILSNSRKNNSLPMPKAKLAQEEKVPEWATKIASSKKVANVLDFTDRNESKLKALISLGLAGILKPIVVLAMPGAKREDKEVTATKNSLSAFIGYGLTCAILDPVSSGVNKFIKHPENYLDKDNELVKEFAKNKAEEFVIHSKEELKQMKYKSNTLNAFKSTYKNGLGIIVAPLKAALTIAIMPDVLKLIFGDRANKKKDTEQQPLYMEPLNNPNMLPEGNNIFLNAFVPANNIVTEDNKFKNVFNKPPMQTTQGMAMIQPAKEAG